ncbi:nitroreductase family deazaflavin-dependent oxidoreductase [uncultured Jatrophihabitans sp.]|uniref:nitroreductase family deazaflavin-dependent oxidoreductase n=1 Tax=uncultured Jatrophihabitans sp. TaxID=1610747 RepID=UPI0035CA1FAA
MGRIEALPVVRAIGTRALQVHQEIYVRSGGRIGHRLFGTRNLILHTTGAKTGAARVNALTYAKDGENYVIVASYGGAPRSPAWYHNLRAHPDTEIQVGTRRVPVTAHTVADDDPDRARLWRLANEGNDGRYTAYQRQTSRQIPVVRLTPR